MFFSFVSVRKRVCTADLCETRESRLRNQPQGICSEGSINSWTRRCILKVSMLLLRRDNRETGCPPSWKRWSGHDLWKCWRCATGISHRQPVSSAFPAARCSASCGGWGWNRSIGRFSRPVWRCLSGFWTGLEARLTISIQVPRNRG